MEKNSASKSAELPVGQSQQKPIETILVPLHKVVYEHVRQVFEFTKSKDVAAKHLQISRSTVYRILREGSHE